MASILIIDDEPEVSELLAEMLEGQARCQIVQDGAKARALLESSVPCSSSSRPNVPVGGYR